MALSRKYAGLPDLDSAPDIYETPELTDDNSTIPGTTLQSHSDAESDNDADDTGISRAKVRVDDARSRFDTRRYNSAGVDWSDRLDGKRRAYRSHTRRSRVLDDGTEELGDISDEDDEEAAESLDRKIARLRREVEEAKEAYARKRAAAATAGEADGDQDEEDEDEYVEGLGSLGRVLEEISRPAGYGRATTRAAGKAPAAQAREGEDTMPQDGVLGEATYTVTYAPAYEQSHALAKAAEFEQRLVALEKSIGLGSGAGLELGLNGLPRAILPTVDAMHQQISALGKASTTSLDSISRRVRTITLDLDNLNKKKVQAVGGGPLEGSAARYADSLEPQKAGEREAAGGARERGEQSTAATATGQDDQAAKINALYGTLATIESLAPLLQPLLDRLRSLRAIHADAAAASETLDRVEKQQSDMAAELRQWREGLEKITGAMREGGETMGGNMTVMETWVRDLEARMEKLST